MLESRPSPKRESSEDAARIVLPARFAPTHLTRGLTGYPAIDLFGPAGALVQSGFWGEVIRISGRPCSEGGSPGGAYGRSVYVLNRPLKRIRFITHLDDLYVSLGQRIKPGSVIGTICDSAVSGKPGTSHVHLGMKG